MRNVSSYAVLLSALTIVSPAVLIAQAGGGLSITNYQAASETRYSRTQWFVTYSAQLTNTGPARAGVTASLTSLSPAVKLVPGQGVLHFGPVPANSSVWSSDTFTVIADSVPIDYANFSWSFVNPVAVPAASANPSPARVGSIITLNGSASANPSGTGTLTYAWSFASTPAGSNATIANPNSVTASFAVDVPGQYIAKLTVNNGAAQDSGNITISTGNSKPVANAGPNQTARPGATVQLNGAGSTDADGDPLTYFWTLIGAPRGSAAFIANFRSVQATTTLDYPGEYKIQLVVNDGHEDSLPSLVTIATGNSKPVANAGPDQSVTGTSPVQLNGSGSTDVDGNQLTYKWTLLSKPAGSAGALSDPSAVNPKLTIDKAGQYTLQLIVNDGQIDSDPDTVSITVNAAGSQGPTANAGSPQTVVHGSTVTLQGSGTDPQNLPLTFAWSLTAKPAGSSVALSGATLSNPTFVADRPGDYVAQLIVGNGSLSSAPVTVKITTTNTAPVANPGVNQTVVPGSTVTLNGGASSDADNDPLTYSWSISSRPQSSNAALSGATSKTPVFLADLPGTYVVQLIVSDAFSSSSPSTVTIAAGSSGGPSPALSPAMLTILTGSPDGSMTLTLPAPTQKAVTFSLTSSNPNVANVPPRAPFFAGGQSISFKVSRGPAGGGTATIIASAPGYSDTTAAVVVQSPGTISLFLGQTNLNLWTPVTLTAKLSSPAPIDGTAVTFATDTTRLSISPSTIVIPRGQTTGTTQVTGVQLGSPAITASASGYATSPVITAQVGATIAWEQQNMTIQGTNKDAYVYLILFATVPGDNKFNPANGIPVTLTSSRPGVATVQASANFFWDGSNAPATRVPVHSVTPGTTTITAVGLNIAPVTMTVTIVGP